MQRSLDHRLQNIANFDNVPSAPHDVDGDDDDDGHMYPSLQNLPTMPRWDTHYVTLLTTNIKQQDNLQEHFSPIVLTQHKLIAC